MRTYQRAIFFTKVPLGGHFKYKDIFQIFPADLNFMPDSSFKRHYPNILEYWFTEDEIITREHDFESLRELAALTATTVNKEDTILSLLTSFTNNRFFRYTDYEDFWGIPMLYDEITDEVSAEVNSWSAKWCMKGYHFPELPAQLRMKEFSKPEINEVPIMPHNLFYTLNPNLDNDRQTTIYFPSTINLLLDAYFSFEKEIREILDSAIGYNVSAIELSTSKRTLSLLSSFTAMETMINLEYRNMQAENCEVCGQLKFGIAKKFREYLLKYVGHSAENKKKFNSYYSLRSKIVHTGMRLKSELLFSEYPRNQLDEEYITRVEILQVGKLAITNWLLKNKRTP